MNIQETTQSQRVTISVALDGMFGKVARAHRLLGRVWDDYALKRNLWEIDGYFF